MSQLLRYQISNWNQIVDCLSNNSRNLYITLSKVIDRPTISGQIIKVRHSKYGTLFAAILNGHGKLLNNCTEDNLPLPFMSTEEILTELQRFGFYITYDVKCHLPDNILDFLTTVDNLGYDKITKVCLETTFDNSSRLWLPTTIVMKSQFNDDLLTYGCKVTRKVFNKKLTDNVIMNIQNEPDMKWDWVKYIANIEDILLENAGMTGSETDANPNCGIANFTPYLDAGDVQGE